MLLALVASVAILAAATVVGGAVCRLGGLAAPGAAPAVGLATLLAVAGPAALLPGGAHTALGTLAVVTLAALAATVRGRVRAGLADAVPVAAAALALLSLPWLAAGRFGVLAMGVNNDTPVHLVAARWLLDRAIPVADTLVSAGYPIGPHAVAAALAVAGVPLVSGLTAVGLVAPPAAALAALDGLRGVRRPLRWALALLAGLGYMTIAYFGQMAFKETLAAALALAFALLLPSVAAATRSGPRAAARAALPPAALLAGAVQIMSWPGLMWPLATLGAWLALECAARRRHPRALLAAARPALWSGTVAFALLISLEVSRIVAFQSSHYAHEPEHGLGNLEHVIPPYEALGVWLGPDFRFAPRLPVLTALLLAGAAVLVGLGVRTWWRRGERALVAAIAGGFAVWAVLALAKNGYNAAKGLAVPAPAVGLALVTGALVAWRAVAPASRPAAGRAEAIHYAAVALPPTLASVARALVAAVLAAAALSSLWTLRDAVVGADAHGRELRSLAAAAPPGPMLVLDNSDFLAWDLYGVEIWRPPLLYPIHTVSLRPEKQWSGGQPFDLDSVSSDTLNQFASVLTARSPAGSTPPPGLRVLRRTPSFVLWERVGTVPPRQILREGWLPGVVLDCSNRATAALVRRPGWALVRSPPIVATAPGWRGAGRDAGSRAERTLRLPPGRWDLSLQYISRNPIDVRVGSQVRTLPATLDRLGPLFTAGSTDGGVRRVEVRVHPLGAVGRLLGAPGATRALDSWRNQPLGALVATRQEAPRRIPLARACGRYVDGYTLG